MKPTDKERREVACRLRGIEAVQFDEGELVDCGEVETELCLASDDGAWYRLEDVLRLADLVEPAPDRTCRAEQDYEAMDDGIPDCRIWRCECGEKFPFWRGLKPIYCPLCGAKVIEEES